MKPLPVETIAHYRIVELIGAGGMGAVYKAFDNKLHRTVALKLLPSEYVSQEDRRRRFFQEARAASALNHPHILTVYEVGEVGTIASLDPLRLAAVDAADDATPARFCNTL